MQSSTTIPTLPSSSFVCSSLMQNKKHRDNYKYLTSHIFEFSTEGPLFGTRSPYSELKKTFNIIRHVRNFLISLHAYIIIPNYVYLKQIEFRIRTKGPE